MTQKSRINLLQDAAKNIATGVSQPFFDRLTELAGRDAVAALVAEFGGSTVYITKPGIPQTAPVGWSCNRASAASSESRTNDPQSNVFWAIQQAQIQLDESFGKRMSVITTELLRSSGEDHRAWTAEAQLCFQLFLDAHLLLAQSPLAASPQSTPPSAA
jgi:hypothetical protein